MLTQRADIKVVAENFGDSHDAPGFFDFSFIFIALRFLTSFFPHSRCGYVLVCQIVCNLFIAPAINVVGEYAPHYLGRRLVNFKGHLFGVCDYIAERNRADPLAFGLSGSNDIGYLAAGVCDWHFIDEEVELDLHPVVDMILIVVHTIADGNDTEIAFGEILEFGKPLACSA